MLENIAVLAVSSLLAVGTYAYTLAAPNPQEKIISPLPSNSVSTLSPTATPTPSPTMTPTLTPTAIPTPTATPTAIITSEDLERLFSQYSSQYSVENEQLKRIAQCESEFNSQARYLDYGGLFQFSSASWNSTRSLMGLDPNPDLRFNAEEAIKTAAFKISQEGISAWPNCQ